MCLYLNTSVYTEKKYIELQKIFLNFLLEFQTFFC